MAVVANQAVAFDKSMLTACRFKPANLPIEERTTGGPISEMCSVRGSQQIPPHCHKERGTSCLPKNAPKP